MSYELTGVLVEVSETKLINDRLSKRDVVIETTSGSYKEEILFQLVNDRCNLIDGYLEGEQITVNFNLKGKRYEKEGRTVFFNNLDIWKIKGV